MRTATLLGNIGTEKGHLNMSTSDLLSILNGDIRSETAGAGLPLGSPAAPPLPLTSMLRHRSPDEIISDPRIMIVDDELIVRESLFH